MCKIDCILLFVFCYVIKTKKETPDTHVKSSKSMWSFNKESLLHSRVSVFVWSVHPKIYLLSTELSFWTHTPPVSGTCMTSKTAEL